MASQKRIEDASEKIDGVRKDFSTHPLSFNDLIKRMSDQLVLVTRDHIWSSKPLEVFQQEGVDCDVALFVRDLREAIPPNITLPDQASTFIELVTKVRDCAALLKTSEALRKSDPNQFEKALIDAGVLQKIQYEGYPEYKLNPKYIALFQHCDGKRLAAHLENTLFFFFRSNAAAAFDHQAFRDNVSGRLIDSSQMSSDEMYKFILGLKPVHPAKDEDDKAQPTLSRPKLY